MNNKELARYINNKKRLRHRKKVRRLKIIYSLCIIFFVLTSSKIIINKTLSNKSPKANEIAATEDVFTVCLDAGHGDWDHGTIGLNNTNEKDVDLSLTLKVGKLLEAEGIKVVYTRTTDKLTWSDNSTENLYDRIAISDKNNADLFISIHCNSSEESSSYNGIETWCNGELEADRLLATYIQDELSALEYTEDRGIKFYDPAEPLIVLEHTDITSALIEVGFISNPEDVAFLTSKNGQKLISEAISRGIIAYINTLEL